METRQINLPLDTARRWYEQGGELKEMALGAFEEKELIEYRLPKTWEEYRKLKGDEGEKANAALNFAYTSINGAFTDYHDTQKHIALMKLHLLRDEYRNGWKPNCDNASYCIIHDSDDFYVCIWSSAFYFLSFKDNKIGNEFLNNFRDLIVEAGDLI